MLCNYLKSDFLIPPGCENAIKEMIQFEELDELHATIIKTNGPLVEIGDDGEMWFIPLAVLELLAQVQNDPAVSSPSKPVLSVDPKALRGVLATECLSYLLFDVRVNLWSL